jgi:hypothetical protein
MQVVQTFDYPATDAPAARLELLPVVPGRERAEVVLHRKLQGVRVALTEVMARPNIVAALLAS